MNHYKYCAVGAVLSKREAKSQLSRERGQKRLPRGGTCVGPQVSVLHQGGGTAKSVRYSLLYIQGTTGASRLTRLEREAHGEGGWGQASFWRTCTRVCTHAYTHTHGLHLKGNGTVHEEFLKKSFYYEIILNLQKRF